MPRRRGREENQARGVSRRGLFKGAGLAAASGALWRPLEALADDAAHEIRTQGPGPVTITLTLNGRERSITVEPRTTLLEALRLPPVSLTGAKPVCERGTCGACTVWLDAHPVYACSTLAVEAEGRAVVTVEGLGTPEKPHPVQAAFVAEDALQCGFCTPGFVMATAHALEQHGKALTAEQVKAATAGNLCRCGVHPHVVRAALRAARGG